MRSYRLPRTTSLDDLALVEADSPQSGRGQVLVRIRTTPLNYRDLLVAVGRSGGVDVPPDFVPLSDGAGEVAAVGTQVTHLGARTTGSQRNRPGQGGDRRSVTGTTRRDGSAKPAPAQVSAPSLDLSALPLAVQHLRARILKAAAGGDIDDLEIPLGWNELQPLFVRGQKGDFDPVAYLKTRSFDGQGREMLGVLRAVFTAPYAREVRGPTVSYLWPVFPVPLERAPTVGQQLHVWRCVRFADLTATAPAPDGGPLIHRAAIGEDGTWQFFWTEPSAI